MTERGPNDIRTKGIRAANQIVDAVSNGIIPVRKLLHTYDFADAIGYDEGRVGEVLYGLAALKLHGLAGNVSRRGSFIRAVTPVEAENRLKRRSYLEELAIDAIVRDQTAENL